MKYAHPKWDEPTYKIIRIAAATAGVSILQYITDTVAGVASRETGIPLPPKPPANPKPQGDPK